MSATGHRAKSLASHAVIGDLVRQVACVAAVVLGAVMLVGALVAAVASAQARQVIAYQFPAGILGWRGVGVVLLDNVRLAVAPIAGAYLIELVRPLVGKGWSGWRRAVRSGCDAALGGAVLTNVVIAGASLSRRQMIPRVGRVPSQEARRAAGTLRGALRRRHGGRSPQRRP